MLCGLIICLSMVYYMYMRQNSAEIIFLTKVQKMHQREILLLPFDSPKSYLLLFPSKLLQ